MRREGPGPVPPGRSEGKVQVDSSLALLPHPLVSGYILGRPLSIPSQDWLPALWVREKWAV